jgi:hypothetical protein
MGDETRQFATRFSKAVGVLEQLAGADPELLSLDRERLDRAVREALDAVAAVYGTGTDAVRDWPEQRKRVLAKIAEMRGALARAGVDAEVRRLARELGGLLDTPRSGA